MPAICPTWTNERIELLKSHFEAGLSCREIAADIGVSRNAVIGKLTRLNLTRGGSRGGRGERRIERRGRLTAHPRQQYAMLVEIYGESESPIIHEHIDEGNRCSLLELEENRCRWPVNTPGTEDFCFCGNASQDGQSYCPGHSRLAYRPNSRQRFARG